jgi:hypothetical protein
VSLTCASRAEHGVAEITLDSLSSARPLPDPLDHLRIDPFHEEGPRLQDDGGLGRQRWIRSIRSA